MKDIKRTQSYANVAKEIENRGKNMLLLNCFAERAREQGYFSVGAKFDSIVRQEREHCRSLYRIMEDGNDIDTLANLIYCAGELHRSADRLRDAFGKTASEEGFSYLANVINEIAKVDSRTEEEIKCIMSDLKVANYILRTPRQDGNVSNADAETRAKARPKSVLCAAVKKGFFY